MRKRSGGGLEKKHPLKMKDMFVHKYFKGSRTRVFGFHLLVNSRKLNFNLCLHNVMILPPATFPHRTELQTPWIKHSTFTGCFFFSYLTPHSTAFSSGLRVLKPYPLLILLLRFGPKGSSGIVLFFCCCCAWGLFFIVMLQPTTER